MRRKQFTSLPWLFVVVRDPHSRPKQAWAPELKPIHHERIEPHGSEAIAAAVERMQ